MSCGQTHLRVLPFSHGPEEGAITGNTRTEANGGIRPRRACVEAFYTLAGICFANGEKAC